MKAQLYLMILLSLCTSVIEAQDSTILKNPSHRKTFTTQVFGDQNVRGYLQSFNDSSLNISNKKVKLFGERSSMTGYIQCHYQDIDFVKIRKSGSAGRGILYGALAGMAGGIIVGIISYKKPPPSPGWNIDLGPGLAAIAGGSLGTVIGGIAGGIIGSKSHKYRIDKNLKNFREMNAQILKMATRK